MRRALVALSLLASLTVARQAARADSDGGPVPGPVSEFAVLLGFAAKESCSCVFVDGQTDAYCNAFGQDPPYMVTLSFNHQTQVVTSTYLGASRTAHATAGAGCTLDPL